MRLKCSDCNKNLIEESKDYHWTRLANFIHLMLCEETITETTYEVMMDSLMYFKGFAFDYDKKDETSDKQRT